MNELSEWIGKSVFIKLKSSGDVYNAIVLDILNGNKIIIRDKFGDRVLIDIDDILKLKELTFLNGNIKGGNNGD